MTNEDLVSRLDSIEPYDKNGNYHLAATEIIAEAQDRIEQLEREKAELQSEVGFLTAFADPPDMETHKTTRDELRDELRTANTEADTLARFVLAADRSTILKSEDFDAAISIAERRVNGE